MAEPEPWQGAASGGPLFLLQTGLFQPHLRAPVPATEAPGAQASLSKDWPQSPQLPTFLGCLGSPLGLQQRKARVPKLPVHAVSLAEGRGEREFLRFLHLKACFVFRQGLNGALPSHVRSFALGAGCPHWARTALSESLPGGVPGAE